MHLLPVWMLLFRKPRSLRYQMGKTYTQINQSVEAAKRARALLVGVLITLVVIGSLGLGIGGIPGGDDWRGSEACLFVLLSYNDPSAGRIWAFRPAALPIDHPTDSQRKHGDPEQPGRGVQAGSRR